MIPTKKQASRCLVWGICEKGENHSEETKLRRTGATQRLYEPQPLSGLWSWIVGFGLPSGLALPFKFAGVFVLLIEKGIVVDFLFRKVDAVDFLAKAVSGGLRHLPLQGFLRFPQPMR